MCGFYFIQTPLDICMKENINLRGVCDKTHISYHGFWDFNTFVIMRRTQHLLFSEAIRAEKWSTSYPYFVHTYLLCPWLVTLLSILCCPFAVGVTGLGVGCLRVTLGFESCQGWKGCRSPQGRWDHSGGPQSLFLVTARVGIPADRRSLVFCGPGSVWPPLPQLCWSWACCNSSHRLLLWKKVGSWVLLCFNHLMTLCPVQYQFVKVSGALHKIKSFDILHPSSKCNKNILSDLSQWHSAGENLSHSVWPSVLERHIKMIPPCYVVVLDSLKFQLVVVISELRGGWRVASYSWS